MKISMIACVDKRFGLGYKGNMLYHISEDLQRFKKFTYGCPVIMGYNTYKSIGFHLSGRFNIVVSRSHPELKDEPRFKTVQPVNWLGYTLADSPEEAIKIALRVIDTSSGNNEIFIIGGAQIYKAFEKYVDTIYFTFVDDEFAAGGYKEADTFFPISVIEKKWKKRKSFVKRDKETYVKYWYETWHLVENSKHADI